MRKSPLIGVSIIAVVLLVLGSLTNVVGYQSVKSTTVNDSPLFQTRTQRATNQQQNIVTSQYLGMGKETHIYLPDRDKRIESINIILNYIKRMDDKSLRRLAFLIQYTLPQNNEIKEFDQAFDTEEIFQGLKELRHNSDIDIGIIEKSKEPKMRSNICSIYCTMEFSREYLPFLIIFFIIIILDFIFLPVGLVLQLLTIA